MPGAKIQRMNDTTHPTGAGVESAGDGAGVTVVAVGIAIAEVAAGGARESVDCPRREHRAAVFVGGLTAVEVGVG